MAVSDGSGVVVYKDVGLVAQVFDEPTLASLRGQVAIGHTRYSTTGGSTWENAQPTIRSSSSGTTIALAHNGNLVNTAELTRELAGTLARLRRRHQRHRPGDDAAGQPTRTSRSRPPRWRCCRSCGARSASSSWTRPPSTPPGTRTAYGRWCSAGSSAAGSVASETAALDIVGASVVREVEPGELLAIDEEGLRSFRFATPEPKGCLFEYVYIARPDATIAGRNVYATRVEIGRRLAEEHPVDADLVIGVPESGIPAAIGYAEASGIPYGSGLVKNPYVGRTFIQPSPDPAPARHPAQAQPAARERARQAAGRGRRLDRARQHPAGDRADAARGRGAGGARTHLLPAGQAGPASTASTSPPAPS